MSCGQVSKADRKAELTRRNFTKFLVNREGHVVGRYSPNTTPEQLKVEIEKLL
jgi:glutathione peroxidase